MQLDNKLILIQEPFCHFSPTPFLDSRYSLSKMCLGKLIAIPLVPSKYGTRKQQVFHNLFEKLFICQILEKSYRRLYRLIQRWQRCSEVKWLRHKTTNLSSCKNSNTSLILTQECNAASREIIFLFSLSCGKVKYAVSNPVPSFQNSMHSFKDTCRKKLMCFMDGIQSNWSTFNKLLISMEAPVDVVLKAGVFHLDERQVIREPRDLDSWGKSYLPFESTFTARISVFSGIHSFLGVLWKQSGTFGVPPVFTTWKQM